MPLVGNPFYQVPESFDFKEYRRSLKKSAGEEEAVSSEKTDTTTNCNATTTNKDVDILKKKLLHRSRFVGSKAL